MKYKYSIKTSEGNFDSLEHMFKTLHGMGYTAIDTSGGGYFATPVEEKNYCEKFVRLAKEYDIELNQSHAPIVINQPEDYFLSKEFRDRTQRCLERIARLGIKNVAMHGYVPEGIDFFRNGKTYDYKKLEAHNREINLQFFDQFTSFVKQEGMVLCLENLFAYDILMQRHVLSVCGDPNETLYYIDQLGSDCFAACYDSGHLNHFGADEYKFITTLGDHLKMTHFHDSWGKDFTGMDWHHLPGDGDVDWMAIKKGLADIGYKGSINAEIGLKPVHFRDIKLRYLVDAFKIIFED